MASQPPEHLQQIQNDTSGSQGLKANEYQQQTPQQGSAEPPKLQNGVQAPSEHGGKGMKSPPSNGSSSGHGPQDMPPVSQGYHQDPNLPQQMHQQPPHMMPHNPGGGAEKDDMQAHHHHQQQHPMYGHQPMHPMHAPQHMPGHHLPMHPHQQRYPHHPHAGGPPPPHGPMQHPMHPHDPNQQQMDPYAHYRGPGMMGPRPPQRYGMPPQGPIPNSTGAPPAGAQQGPTPTLNSLLQSQPSPQQTPQSGGPPPPHRYYDPNVYGGPPPNAGNVPPGPPNSGSSSPMPPQSQQQQQQQGGWVPPRPYSPQYRGPPPVS